MRGDSIRDLYAKTLALLGLGVIAGAGALVDYWPTGITLPVVAPVQTALAPAGPLPLDSVGLPEPPAPVMVADARPANRQPARTTEQASPASDMVLPAAFVRPQPIALTGHDVALAPPVARLSFDVTRSAEPVEMTYEPLAPEDLELYAEPEPMLIPTRASLVSSIAADDGDGLLTGAMKKTGSSIVRTGVKTGASFLDAVRVVSSAVRRALPVD